MDGGQGAGRRAQGAGRRAQGTGRRAQGTAARGRVDGLWQERRTSQEQKEQINEGVRCQAPLPLT